MNPSETNPSEQNVSMMINSEIAPKVESTKSAIRISGELFLTLKNGDVKRAAGLTTYFTPVSREMRDTIKTKLPKLNQIEQNYESFRDQVYKKYPSVFEDPKSKTNMSRDESREKEINAYRKKEYDPHADPLMKSLKAAVEKDRYTVNADGDGKFTLEVIPGSYVIWTEELSILRDQLRWCKVIDISNKTPNIVLDQNSAILGKYITDPAGNYYGTHGVNFEAHPIRAYLARWME